MFETDAGEQYCETERDEWVRYEDYAELKELLDALAYSVLNYPLSPDTEELAKEALGV
ncbi:hypothetical protein V7I88_004565 [Salmonella enterica]